MFEIYKNVVNGAYRFHDMMLARLVQLAGPEATVHEPHLRAFYQRLVNRGKARLQAVVAVMRKLLHGLFAMFRSNQSYDGTKLCGVPAGEVTATCV